MLTTLRRGVVAGAAGVSALNAVTYADMAWRGRPASTAPERTVERADVLPHLAYGAVTWSVLDRLR